MSITIDDLDVLKEEIIGEIQNLNVETLWKEVHALNGQILELKTVISNIQTSV